MDKEKVYYTIERKVDSNIYQFVTVVEDEDIAKDLCHKHFGWEYTKEIIKIAEKRLFNY